MRKLVVILLALFALFTLINAYTEVRTTGVPRARNAVVPLEKVQG